MFICENQSHWNCVSWDQDEEKWNSYTQLDHMVLTKKIKKIISKILAAFTKVNNPFWLLYKSNS